jgi:4-hydroxy-2-oxoheptanedioate aldolase
MSAVTVRTRWASGETAYGLWCMSGSPFVAEMMGLEGFHYVCLDLQHGLMGYDSFLACMYAVTRTESTPIVRVPSLDSELIGKVLDAGAHGVIVPMVESAAEAARAVSACRYFPEGRRSIGSSRGIYTLGNDPELVNRQVICLVMIETAIGVRNVEEICSVPGVDGVYLGPGDLAITLGLQPTLTSQLGEHADSIERVRAVCHARGIVAGIQCESSAAALERSQEGFRMVTVTTDVHVLRSGFRNASAEVGLAARSGAGS